MLGAGVPVNVFNFKKEQIFSIDKTEGQNCKVQTQLPTPMKTVKYCYNS